MRGNVRRSLFLRRKDESALKIEVRVNTRCTNNFMSVVLSYVGPVKATEAADAWAAVLDRMEEAWMASSNGNSGGTNSTAPTPPLRVFMRLGALYNTLGRVEEAKARGT